jgi:hypothetical protein
VVRPHAPAESTPPAFPHDDWPDQIVPHAKNGASGTVRPAATTPPSRHRSVGRLQRSSTKPLAISTAPHVDAFDEINVVRAPRDNLTVVNIPRSGGDTLFHTSIDSEVREMNDGR